MKRTTEGQLKLGTFEVCVLAPRACHIALRNLSAITLASKLCLSIKRTGANKHAELAGPPLFSSVNCIKYTAFSAGVQCT